MKKSKTKPLYSEFDRLAKQIIKDDRKIIDRLAKI